MSLRRLIASVIIVLVLVVVGYGAYVQYLAPRPVTPTPIPVAAAKAEGAGVVSAKAFVVPRRQAKLAFKVGGQVKEILVDEGQAANKGQVLARLDDRTVRLQIAQAEAALKAAQAQLAQVKAGARQEAVAAAEAALSGAKANLARLKAGPKPEEIAAAKALMDKAAAAVQLAQAEYDKIAWHTGIGMTPQAVALQQATLDYESAKARYEALVRGATPEELAQAQAQVDQAEAQLALTKAGARPEEIALAQAQVDQAQAALDQARSALKDLELVAPFAGTVAALNVEEGEMVTPAVPVVVFGDLTRLHVETDDLSEVDVAQIAVGQAAKVTVDALPGKEFRGQVTQVAPLAVTKRGDVTFTVTIELDTGVESGLRWGMTAFVDVETGK